MKQKESPLWMGNYVLSFDYPQGILHKIEVSTYGGFYYLHASRKYYVLPEGMRRGWLEYMNACYGRLEQGK